VLANAHAVHVDQQRLLFDLGISRREGAGAQTALFFIIKQDERGLIALLPGHARHGFHHRGHARGIVIHVVGVGRAGNHQQKQRIIDHQGDDQRQACIAHQQLRAHKGNDGNQQQCQDDPQLIQGKHGDIARRHQVGNGQARRGIIVGGIDHLRMLGAAKHHVAVPSARQLLHPRGIAQGLALRYRPFAKHFFFFIALPNRKARRNILQVAHFTLL